MTQPDYWVEEFTDDERARLAPYVTNLDRPVFALRNLPETVKGALFARYSRSGKTLRRLFLDEFADQVQDGHGSGGSGRRGPGNPGGVPRSVGALVAPPVGRGRGSSRWRCGPGPSRRRPRPGRPTRRPR